jgi:transcription antitermination factor NusG
MVSGFRLPACISLMHQTASRPFVFSRWFIVLTTPKAEHKAAFELRRAGIRVYIPKRTKLLKGKAGKGDRHKHVPLLAGYVLIRFPTAMHDRHEHPHFGIAKGCQGVRDFVRWVNRAGEKVPVPVPDIVVREFIARQRGREFDDEAINRARRELRWAGFRDAMKAGDPMQVISGPFESFLATIVSFDEKNGADVLIEIFGRLTPVHMDEPEQFLEPVAKSAKAA